MQAQPARRKVSSELTLFVKFLVPAALMVAAFCYLIGFALFASHQPLGGFLFGLCLILVIGAGLSYLAVRTAGSLKEVSIDSDFIYVSNFRREISVPLSEVDEVGWRLMLKTSMKPVWVKFEGETEYGRKVTFLARYRFFGIGAPPVVNEILAMAVEARRRRNIQASRQ